MTTHSFNADVARVLHLMIHALYTNKDIFLRELISNASDACDRLRYAAQADDRLLADNPEMAITIHVDTDKRLLVIRDTGIGMNDTELADNLGTIARSGTQEFLKTLTGNDKGDREMIGQFGVGFYSAFMVADHITVCSRKAGSTGSWQWESDGGDHYTLTPVDTSLTGRGTEITLHLREGEDDYLDRFRLSHIVRTYSDHISIPIRMVQEDGTEMTINAGSALWMRPKKDITPEQYQEFYQTIAMMPGEPWMTIHHKAEGTIEYTSLLYIPGTRPFDLFHPDRRRRVKLYIKRVFITDEGVELIPQWLRFLRGVVDSEDLPLNISRETLQHNRILDKIRQGIIAKLLSELSKRAGDDPESYSHFWQNFGAVIKEGLCDSFTTHADILHICRFYSTLSDGKLISLSDYISRMKEGQTPVYYLVGEDREALLRSPQLEGFRKQGIEVLLLTDPVDDFWVNTVHQYQERDLRSVTRTALPGHTPSGDPKEDAPAIALLIAALKTIYGSEVKDVRTTGKLAESPVCLAVGEQDMDIRFERFLVENKQLAGTSAHIMEINPQHPVVLALAERVSKEGAESPAVQNTAWLLLDQAKVIEGEPLRDPGAFSQRLTALLQQGLAA